MGHAHSTSLSQCALSAMRAKPTNNPHSVPMASHSILRRITTASDARKNPQATCPLTKEQLLSH
jgi:hypothetical protein